MASDILIVDDEADIRELISGILEDEGHGTRVAKDSDETLQAIEERRPSLVILDIWLQGSRLDGLELLEEIKKAHPDLPVIIISGHGNIETAVSAIQRGAYDYIEKPFKADRLVLITARALETSKLKRENRELRERSSYSFEMVGTSPAIAQLQHALGKVAPTNSRVLISGPSGCGKELAARVMHAKSQRADGPFVVLNAGVGTLRNGGGHRHGAAKSRRARGGSRRHALHRRDCRHAARDPGKDPSGARRTAVPTARRWPEGACRRAGRVID
jgi:two-component system nitrogen regulation response regulator NtrX